MGGFGGEEARVGLGELGRLVLEEFGVVWFFGLLRID